MKPAAEALHWLLAGLSGRPHAPLPPWVYWHARLMVTAWTLLLPSGMLIARFFKITARQQWPDMLDNRLWWRSHWCLQTAGMLLAVGGAALAYGRGAEATRLAQLHHLCGWTVVLSGLVQMSAGLLRGSKGGPGYEIAAGDHYVMSWRRVLFEYVHKTLGWAATAMAVGVTAAGLLLVDAPRWMALVIAAWWLGYLFVFTLLQMQSRCVDTYQAIWGPDPAHPGNARRPIGWKVHRPEVTTRPDLP